MEFRQPDHDDFYSDPPGLPQEPTPKYARSIPQ